MTSLPTKPGLPVGCESDSLGIHWNVFKNNRELSLNCIGAETWGAEIFTGWRRQFGAKIPLGTAHKVHKLLLAIFVIKKTYYYLLQRQ